MPDVGCRGIPAIGGSARLSSAVRQLRAAKFSCAGRKGQRNDRFGKGSQVVFGPGVAKRESRVVGPSQAIKLGRRSLHVQEHWRAARAQDGHKPYQEPGAIADCQQHAVAGPKRIFLAREPVSERVAHSAHLSPVQLQSAIEIAKGAAVILEEVEKGRGGEI